jgi:TDG/mug DNA glycosylase family protein
MIPMLKLDKSGPLPRSNWVPDLLAPDLRIVFCGTALGRLSAERKAYYANPGNFFWRTLHATGLTPKLIAPEDYAKLLSYGLGLTDLCKSHYGNDAQLPPGALDAAALRQKILLYQPRILAFTSKAGASVFLDRPTGAIPLGLQSETVKTTRIFVLPSPSGQARIFWNPEIWKALAALARGTG